MERSTAWSAATNVSTRFISILVCLTAAGVGGAALSGKVLSSSPSYVAPFTLLIGFCVISCVIARLVVSANRAHRKTLDVLDSTNRRYRSIYDNSLDAILIFDEEGICLEANPAASSLFRLPCKDLRGQSISRFLRAKDDWVSAQPGLLNETEEHAEAGALRADGHRATVEYRVIESFLPGLRIAVLRDITRKKQTETALRVSERRFQQMADNIQEIFWIFDVQTRELVYVNAAYEPITGRLRSSTGEFAASYTEIIHGEDRARVLSRLSESAQKGKLDEEFRIVRPDGAIRWLRLRGSLIRDGAGAFGKLVGTAEDITARKVAQDQMAHSVDVAKSARAETGALRKVSLALTQNLSMDYVLDTLLQALLELAPCELAQVILREAGARLLLAREVTNGANGHTHVSPATFDADGSRQLTRALTSRESVFVPDTAQDPDWPSFKGFSHLHSWLCVPLIASNEIVGLLSLGDMNPHAFTPEHLRLTESLAIPAAVAIQSARLYEQTEIFRSELQQRVTELQRAERLSGDLQRFTDML